jgi:hypothetical protein
MTSAKRTGSSPTSGSPAGHPGWGGAVREGVFLSAHDSTPSLTVGLLPHLQSPVPRAQLELLCHVPSTEVLGYFRPVRFADLLLRVFVYIQS